MKLCVVTVCVHSTEDDEAMIFNGFGPTETDAMMNLNTGYIPDDVQIGTILSFTGAEGVGYGHVSDILLNSSDPYVMVERLGKLPNIVIHVFYNTID